VAVKNNDVEVIRSGFPRLRKVRRGKRNVYVLDMRGNRYYTNAPRVIQSYDRSKIEKKYLEIKDAFKSRERIDIYEQYNLFQNQLLKYNKSVSDVVRDFLAQQTDTLTFGELVGEYTDYILKQLKEGPSRSTVENLLSLLKRSPLAKIKLTELNEDDVKSYLATVGNTNTTKLNRLRRIKAVLNYAIKKQYLQFDPTSLIKIKGDVRNPEIIDTSKLIACLKRARSPQAKAFLILKSQLGLRNSEVQNLDLKSAINTEKKLVVIEPAVSKTGKRRLIDYSDTSLQPWIDFLSMDAFTEINDKTLNQYTCICRAEKIPNNAFRHSAITYWIIKDDHHSYAECALRHGNSPAMIEKNYMGAVNLKNDRSEALKWYAVTPDIIQH
jgi:site-specific recombinase XerD